MEKVKVLRFKDRFQEPMSGGYMDMQLLVDIDGFVCELQINLSCILEIKESDAGHGQYEEERKAIDEMIYCAMQGPASDFAAKLDKVKTAQDLERQDMYGLRALHYAAQRGEISMVQQLLDRDVKLTQADQTGMIPLHMAVLLGHKEVVADQYRSSLRLNCLV